MGIQDLFGVMASGAMVQLGQRGFTNLGGSRSGSNAQYRLAQVFKLRHRRHWEQPPAGAPPGDRWQGRWDAPSARLGFWAVHRTLARPPLLELNVSSLSDWPIAYRRLSFAYDADAQRLQVRADLMPHGDQPVKNYADLMAAWEAETCARTGLPTDLVKEFHVAVVKKQRESRGSLMEWLLAAIPCETCEQTLYKHAQAYQDALLKTLLQGAAAAKRTGVKLPGWKTPAACGGAKLTACANALMAEQPHDYESNVDLFRRKAALVAAANDSLDRLDFPKAKA